MAKQPDRRVQRTRKLLRDSLLGLILEEGYEEISIQDITNKANLGRATFYLHYKDKDELLLAVMDQLIVDFMDQIPQVSGAQWQLVDLKAIVKLFEFAEEHYDLYRILTIGSGGIKAARQIHRSIAKNINTFIQAELYTMNTDPVVPVDFIANHFTGSLLSTIYWWLDNDLPYSAEEIAAMFQKANLLDRERLLGFKETDTAAEMGKIRGKRKKRAKEKEMIQTAITTQDFDLDQSEIGSAISALEDET